MQPRRFFFDLGNGSIGHAIALQVLVNDFGDIDIDASLVEGVEDATISLANGCI